MEHIRTSLMCPLIINGYMAKTTKVIRQFRMKAITSEVAIIPIFWRRIVERSTTIVRSRVASVSKRDDSIALLLLVSSNQPISFLSIAVYIHTYICINCRTHRIN